MQQAKVEFIMYLHGHGIVRGNRIEFEKDLGIPDGTPVTVHFERAELSIDEKRKIVAESCGSLKDDSLDAVFSEIIADRSESRPRDVNFDVSP